MLRLAVAASLLALVIQIPAAPAGAQTPERGDNPDDTARADSPSPFTGNRRVLGYGRLTTNDVIGDGQDRWRTGSVTMSRAWGAGWFGTAPSEFGALLETRVQGQIIAPANLVQADPTDRPHTGTLSIGVHSPFTRGALEFSVGADLLVIGPQTRLGDLQKAIHGMTGDPQLSPGVIALQTGNHLRPTLVAEIARQFPLGKRTRLRPFTELRAGDETLLRVGADITFGGVTNGELLSRESVTGQRYRVIYRSGPGVSFVFGGDVAHVSQSVYLPADRGYRLTPRRDRVRMGLYWQGRNASVFYGLTYLGREFQAQDEGQVLGSVRLKVRF